MSHSLRHVTAACLALSLVSMGSGCATQSPHVKVLGVSQARQPSARDTIVVFVEVVNPGQRELTLSRLEYRFRAAEWLDSTGKVALSRQISAGASAIVEIPVPVEATAESRGEDNGVPFTLEGRLFADDEVLERSWQVAAQGALNPATRSQASHVRIRTVATQVYAPQ